MTIKQIENYHSQITEQTMENVARSTYKIRIGQNTTNLWSTETTLPFGFPKESSNNGEIRQRRTRSRASLLSSASWWPNAKSLRSFSRDVSDAKIKWHGNGKLSPLPRDEAIRGIRKFGRSGREKRIGYRRLKAHPSQLSINFLGGGIINLNIDVQSKDRQLGRAVNSR